MGAAKHIRAVTFFSYRSYVSPYKAQPWTDAELGVLRFVRAIKARPVGGSSPIVVRGALCHISKDTAGKALGWFAEMAVDMLEHYLETTRVVLVPIPDADCTLSGMASRTARLSEAVAQRCEAASHDLLRWTKKMSPASQGGPRSAQMLYPYLRVRRGFAPMNRPYVLIDDVCTTGGHVRACAARLKEWGDIDVILAIAGAQTQQEPVDPYAATDQEHAPYLP